MPIDLSKYLRLKASVDADVASARVVVLADQANAEAAQAVVDRDVNILNALLMVQDLLNKISQPVSQPVGIING